MAENELHLSRLCLFTPAFYVTQTICAHFENQLLTTILVVLCQPHLCLTKTGILITPNISFVVQNTAHLSQQNSCYVERTLFPIGTELSFRPVTENIAASLPGLSLFLPPVRTLGTM